MMRPVKPRMAEGQNVPDLGARFGRSVQVISMSTLKISQTLALPESLRHRVDTLMLGLYGD